MTADDRSLTDLEGAALATIADLGEATAYQVAKSFETSPSEYWSGSAGAVYPMVERLVARGLLEGVPSTQGKRTKMSYRLTRAGEAAHKVWLFDIDRAIGMGFDPLRTRLSHMASAPRAERLAFLAEVEGRLLSLAERPGFPGERDLEKLHQSWLAARLNWIRRLMAIT